MFDKRLINNIHPSSFLNKQSIPLNLNSIFFSDNKHKSLVKD